MSVGGAPAAIPKIGRPSRSELRACPKDVRARQNQIDSTPVSVRHRETFVRTPSCSGAVAKITRETRNGTWTAGGTGVRRKKPRAGHEAARRIASGVTSRRGSSGPDPRPHLVAPPHPRRTPRPPRHARALHGSPLAASWPGPSPCRPWATFPRARTRFRLSWSVTNGKREGLERELRLPVGEEEPGIEGNTRIADEVLDRNADALLPEQAERLLLARPAVPRWRPRPDSAAVSDPPELGGPDRPLPPGDDARLLRGLENPLQPADVRDSSVVGVDRAVGGLGWPNG